MDDDPDERWVRRWRLESWRIVAGVVALVVAASWATDPPQAWEVDVFRLVNDLTTWWGWSVWLLMQAGAVFVAVPATVVALLFLVRDVRSPLVYAAGIATSALVVGVVATTVIERGRPDELLPAVNIGYGIPTTGLGFPSTHTALAVAAAVVLAPYLLRWVRWALYAMAGGVGVATVYMGANLPLDVVAGAALGLVVGSAIDLASGIRRDRAQSETLRG